MKKIYLFCFIIITFIFEIVFTVKYIDENYHQNDVVKINELAHEIEINYGDYNKYPNMLEYAIIDPDGNLVYKSENCFSESLNDAYKNSDTIIEFSYDNKIGKIIVYNNFNQILAEHRNDYIKNMIIIMAIQVITFIIYYIYLYRNILSPFKKMNEFAIRVTDGNLDIPLKMDKNNNFGAFTEAFDIMRCEIKKAREAEKKATEAKKELVAKLSHDIKTPIASIKSYSELGYTVSKENKAQEYFKSINNKSDQMSVMITNLFNSTLEELEELSINISNLNSNIIESLIRQADYLEKCEKIDIPQCIVFADKLRLQQVFDNIFANSYKYAGTDIETNSYIKENYLVIEIRDFGDSVSDDEIPLLTEKFNRGKNAENIDGTGLGLYISKEFLKKMNGNLEIENANPGFKVLIYLRII